MFGVVSAAAGEIIYVDGDGNGLNNGESWINAYNYLQDALTDAISSPKPVEIHVAQGTYTPDRGVEFTTGDREATFQLLNGVTIKGGYAGFGEDDPNARDITSHKTILSGDLGNNDDVLSKDDNSYHVVTTGGMDETAILEGFIITSGNAFTGTHTDGTNPNDHGGAIYNINGDPTINQCTFVGNWAFHGGAVFSDSNGSPTFTNCDFTENAVTGVDNCTGGAVYITNNINTTFINCTFTCNAGNDGGALAITKSTLVISNCTFSVNTSDAQGGAIDCGYNSTLTLTNSRFYGNSASGGGGLSCSYSNTTVTNCTFIGNSAGSGGAVKEYFSYSLKLVNCTIAENTAGYYGGGMRTTSANVMLNNCILWANSDSGGMDESAQVHTQKQIQVRYSCIQNWTQGGTGNINLDPMFAHNPDIGGENYDFGNIHLKTGSPCIDAADNNSVPVDVLTDLDGLNRFYDDPFTPDTGYTDGNKPVVDMGAYEYSQSTPFWKNHVVFPSEPFQAYGNSANDPSWVKFTIFINDPNTLYFQDSQEYIFHYDFATNRLVFFLGMTPQQFYELTLYEDNQQAVLGTVIMPPMEDFAPIPTYQEYGIQFHRHDPYPKEQIADLFDTVKSCIVTDPNVRAFYFPSYEQLPAAEANHHWFESNGIQISSTSRWYQANVSYSDGWALGNLKYFEGKDIQSAYQNGLLEPNDILLTDGVPAEIPFVTGIITLSPTTPNSHVAILTRTFGVPFVHLALAEDAQKAQQLLGKTVFLNTTSGEDADEVILLDIEGALTNEEFEEILALKAPPVLDISQMVYYGAYSASTDGLLPVDIKYFGGKAANFGILRTAIPNKSPVAAAFSFDLWNEFLDQAIAPRSSVIIEPGGYLLFWADNDEGQGPTHTNFKLSKDGEEVGLYDRDGATLIDGISFGQQYGDVSYGRLPDGNDNWVFFSNSTATPNQPNFGSIGGPTQGLFINEFMADNDSTIQNPDGSGYPDWIELYNAGLNAIDLGGMYLTDDMNDPTKWMIPFEINSGTLREEISNRLSGHSYPPSDMAALSADLRAIGHIIKSTGITSFTPQQEAAVIATLQDPNYGFDAYQKIRFRSSTNVEDSNQFTGAGLYDSFSGCLGDDLDGDGQGPCLCDANEDNERGVFRAIRKVFASFYNDNAFLERLRHDVNEAEVGMALLVHHSFPDEFELANGVATLEKDDSSSTYTIKLVTQLGAVSVANPLDGSIPEEVTVIYRTASDIDLTLTRSSNLVILGEKVLQWTTDYKELAQLLVAIADQFATVTGKTTYILDFEYKKLAPGGAAIPTGGLVVKQVRQIPSQHFITPFLVNKPTEYCVFQGVFDDQANNVFAYHRLKSRLQIETKPIFLLSQDNLTQRSFLSDTRLQYFDSGSIRSITGNLPLWPFSSHSFSAGDTLDTWRLHHLQNPRSYELHISNVPTHVSSKQHPVLTISDLGTSSNTNFLKLRVNYDQAVRSCDRDGDPSTTTTDEIHLWPSPQPIPGRPYHHGLMRSRSYNSGNISINTTFCWPNDVYGSSETAPLLNWVQTVIEGCTTDPIILTGFYSQTYCPLEGNNTEHFLFEPRLESGIPQTQLDELEAQNIRLIHFITGTSLNIKTYGFDDESFCSADINDDGKVNFSDFASLANRWLDTVCDDCGGTDLTGDGRVTFKDLLEFFNNWLTGTF
jgi:hypothetical protein